MSNTVNVAHYSVFSMIEEESMGIEDLDNLRNQSLPFTIITKLEVLLENPKMISNQMRNVEMLVFIHVHC